MGATVRPLARPVSGIYRLIEKCRSDVLSRGLAVFDRGQRACDLACKFQFEHDAQRGVEVRRVAVEYALQGLQQLGVNEGELVCPACALRLRVEVGKLLVGRERIDGRGVEWNRRTAERESLRGRRIADQPAQMEDFLEAVIVGEIAVVGERGVWGAFPFLYDDLER